LRAISWVSRPLLLFGGPAIYEGDLCHFIDRRRIRDRALTASLKDEVLDP
jgi:hypothetical protein